MSLSPQYAKPRSVEQAVQVLAGLSTGAMIIAGGQELLPSMNYGHLELEVIVDINGLDQLRGVALQEGRISIGALTVHRDIQQNENILQHAPLLAYAAAQVGGGWQVHNRGTIGGNVVSMHPLYDIIPPLLALGASVELSDIAGTREVALADLLKQTQHGLGVSALLTRILIPVGNPAAGWAYKKLKTTHGAYGSANAAGVIQIDADGKLAAGSLVVGGVSDRPVMLTDILADLKGTAISPGLAEEIGRRASAAVTQPLSDHQGGGSYRVAMAGVMAKRAFSAAAQHSGAA